MKNILLFSLITVVFASCGSIPEAKIKFLDDNTVTILKNDGLNLYEEGDSLFLEDIDGQGYRLDRDPRMPLYEKGVRCYDRVYAKDSTYVEGYCVTNRIAIILKKAKKE